MDQSLRVIAQDRILSWSTSHVGGLDFHNHHHSMMPPRSPPWMSSMQSIHTNHPSTDTNTTVDSRSAPTSANSSSSSVTTTRHPLNGQLSPISTGMDAPPGPSTDDTACCSGQDSMNAPPTLHSASSSNTDSWSVIYGETVEDIDMTQVMDEHDAHWEHGSDDDDITVPKAEPMEEDVRLDEIKEAPPTPVPSNTSPTSTQPKPKRPRGRPRKHPLAPAVAANKITKGRSKTGCLTCRKRKKKCDEAKPRCTYDLL